MFAFDPHVHQDSSRNEDAKWNTLNAAHGGKLETRVREIRSGVVKITRTEAKVVALAEIGFDCMATGDVLGVDEHAVANHRTTIRKKLGKTRKDGDFDMLFLRPPPPKNDE